MSTAIEFDLINADANLTIKGYTRAGQERTSDDIDYAGLETMQEEAEQEMLRKGMRKPARSVWY